MSILILKSISDLRKHVSAVRQPLHKVALVPTMGALHAGHIELVKQGLTLGAHVIVSIFINPLQFAAGEDLSKYPRTFNADQAKLIDAGAHAIYFPDVNEMYPPGFDVTILPGSVARVGLEDACRPTHFQGVTTIVAKLFMQSGADYAVFGKKDFQQLQVVTHMARDLNMPIEIIPVTTLREKDGLAMSSRNIYLNSEERAKASLLYQTLSHAAQSIRQGQPVESVLKYAVKNLSDYGFEVGYFEVRNANTLEKPIDKNERPIRLLAAVKIGTTRLIDNIGI